MKKLMKVALLVMALCLLLTGCQDLPTINVPFENPFDLPFDIPILHHHVWKDATCTTPKSCACGATEGEALGHTVVIDGAKQATCTESGLQPGSHCSVCNDILVAQIVIPAKGHTEKTIAGEAATCTANGLTEGKMCSVCDKILVAQEVIIAKGHKDEDKDFICDIDTCKADLCTNHTEETLEAKAPTCTATGLTEGKKCSVCGEILVAQKIVPVTGHSYNATVTVPTCTEKGYTTYTCGSCGDTYTGDEAAATGIHTTNHEGKCATCGKYTLPAVGTAFKLKMAQNKLGKILYFTGAMDSKNTFYFGTGDINSAVNLYLETAEDGYYIYFLDGETRNYLYIVASGKYINIKFGETKAVWKLHEASGALITTLNDTEYYMGTYGTNYTISVSKISYITDDNAEKVDVEQFIARAVIIPEHECSYSEATCTKLATCSVCGLTTGELKAHSYDEGVVTAPTCTAAGYTTYTCTVCEGTKKEDGAAALGHTTTDGVCGNCGNTITSEITYYVFKATAADGTAYYWDGTVSSGKGTITTDAANAAKFVVEQVEDGYYIYTVVNGVNKYIAIGDSAKSLSLTETATVLSYDAATGYVSSPSTERYIALYNATDIRTYAASAITGSNAYMVLIAA